MRRRAAAPRAAAPGAAVPRAIVPLLLVLGLGLPAQLAAQVDAGTDQELSAQPAEAGLWPDDPLVTHLVGRLQQERAAAGAPAFTPQEDVQAAAGQSADDVTRQGTWLGLDLSVQRTADFLQSQGYLHQELVTSFYAPASSTLRPSPETAASWADEWWGQSGDTFTRLLGPDLRHLGIARGDARGQPFYALVAAVSKSTYWREQTEPLRDAEVVRARILEAVNQVRREHGLRPLTRRAELEQAAQNYADAMLAGDFYGHVAPDGTGLRHRVEATGYDPRRLAENLASGQSSVEQVMEGWLASPGHRANILHRKLRELGVGLAMGDKNGDFKILWVQVFAGKS